MKKLAKLLESLNADLEVIKNIAENADGYLEQDPEQAAKNFSKLVKADPVNTTWRQKTAYAYFKDGGLHWDGSCNNAKSMKLAAELYKPLCEEYPLNGNLFTFAGASHYATGERDKAKKYLERAVALLEDGSNDKDFAERLLKNLK